ncbi:MAG: acyl-CoA thioesterase [Candidatus Eisenbacteria bacterium]|uniref:Acyl-CoA thioesterase n=1 Tax=Eiseniibacteriota bacterium TaxID=2212470 RepID=A0A538SAS0_UNCEI|nr:MAG: acyl-CoA thioesterase [Candidatus Eisenbacteria bacterium]
MVPRAPGVPALVERVLMAIPGFTLAHELAPRFRDTDAMGHINNAVYITYLEVARQEYWRVLSEDEDYSRVPFILAGVQIDFRSEARVSEVLHIGIRCDWIGNKSFAFGYEIREKRSGQVCYDYAAKRSLPMPAELRAKLERYEGRSLARAVKAR